MNQLFRWRIKLQPVNVIFLVLLLTISPYLFLAFFSVPAADDFWQAALALKEGIYGFILYRYFHWSGRFASDALISSYNVLGEILHDRFLINFYYIVPIFLIVVYGFSSYIFISLLSEQQKTKWKIIFSLISTLCMLTHVELRSTVFWLAGGVTYTFANALFLISFGLTLSTIYLEQDDWQSQRLTSLNILLIFLINGFNEALMLANTAIISGLLGFSILFKPFRFREYLRLLCFQISAILSGLLVFLSPGNAVRSAKDAQATGSLLSVIFKSLQSMFIHVFEWINPLWLCLVLLLLFVLRELLSEKLVSYIQDQRKSIPMMLSLGVALYVSYFARWYALGSEGPLRADATSYVLFFLLTVFLVFHLLLNLNFRPLQVARKQHRRILIVSIIFCLLSTAINFRPIKNDLLRLKSHYAYYQTIYPQLATAGPGAIVAVQPEPRVSVLRWQCYLTDDPNYWTNTAMAKYFQVRSVVAVGAEPPEPECGEVETYKKPK